MISQTQQLHASELVDLNFCRTMSVQYPLASSEHINQLATAPAVILAYVAEAVTLATGKLLDKTWHV